MRKFMILTVVVIMLFDILIQPFHTISTVLAEDIDDELIVETEHVETEDVDQEVLNNEPALEENNSDREEAQQEVESGTEVEETVTTEQEEVVEEETVTEEDTVIEEESVVEEEPEVDVEKHGFKLELKQALDMDNQLITVDNKIDAKDVFVLELIGTLDLDHNYTSDDIAKFELPTSVIVNEANRDSASVGNTNVGVYSIDANGLIEVDFADAVESVQSGEMTFEVQVTLNESLLAEDATEAVINPIGTENSIVVPLEVEEPGFSLFAEIERNIFTFSSLTLNGEPVEEGSVIDLQQGTKAQLEFTWDTVGIEGLQAGDTATMQLPDVFADLNSPGEIPLMVSGMQAGTYRILDGELVITFNELVEQGEITEGFVGFDVEFDLEKFAENIDQLINFNDDVGTELNVTAKPFELAEGSDKTGEPDRYHNANEIDWQIDVFNNNEEATSNASLSDVIPAGLGAAENFVIRELTQDLYGNVIEGDITTDYNLVETDDGFTIDFNNIDPYKGYRVEYTTPIEDNSIETFTNDATFNIDGESLPAEATVSGLTRSNPIEKSGQYNEATGQIDWTIVANESGVAMEDLVINDLEAQTAPLSVDWVTLVVERFVDESSVGTVDVEADQFPISLGPVGSNEHFVVTFSTDIDFSVINDGDYQLQNSIDNEAILLDGDEEQGRDEATVEFNRLPLISKEGNATVNYEEKSITWTVELNEAQHNLGNVVVTDELPDGLTLELDDITIRDSSGVVVDNIPTTISANGLVTFDFGNIDDSYTIEYTTEITDFNVNKFTNKIGLIGEGIGEENHETEVEVNPPANSFVKNFEGIDYNARTMDWSLEVNPIREGIENLQIEDTFTNSGMILLPETVVLTHGGNPLALGSDYTLEPRTEDGETGYQKGFIINLIGDYSPLDGGILRVNYETSYDPQLEVDGNTLDPHTNVEGQTQNYINHAHFTGTTVNGNDVDAEDDASTTVRDDSWNSGSKHGQLVNGDDLDNLTPGWESGSERKIAWQLYMNYLEQNLGSGVVITDTLDYFGTIEDVRVSVYDIASNGDTTITGPVLDPSTYTLSITDNSFTLTFNEVVDQRYVVELLTTVPDLSQNVYVNNASVNVDGVEYPYTSSVGYDEFDDFLTKVSPNHEGSAYIGDEVEWDVTVNESLSVIHNAVITDTISAGMEYLVGSFALTTADGTVLSEDPDYSFTSTKTEDGRTILRVALTESLDQEVHLNYTTVVTAEDGDTVNNTISLSGENVETITVETEELTANQFSWASGTFNPARGALQIIKVDSETGEQISSNPAAFDLYYDLNGERVLFTDGVVTNNDGVVTIGNLPLRTYYIEEVESPAGYVIDEADKVIEITEPYGTGQVVFDLVFENTKIKTDVSVTKVWDDADNQDGVRSTFVEVQLTANGENVESSVTLDESNDWSYTWEELDEYTSNGSLIDYSVVEVEVPEGYESQVVTDEDNNITVTNSYEPEVVEYGVGKVWDDADNQDGVRPNNVTVNLLKNGSVILESVVLNEANSWFHVFQDLPKYEDGVEVAYSVTENTVADYSTTIEPLPIADENIFFDLVTNTHTPGQTSATVTKAWDDGNNQDGNRPGSVLVQLFANGVEYGDPVEVTSANNWTYTWTELDLNEAGVAIDYTVEEVEVPADYEISVNNDNHGNLMITNSYTPEVTEISVEKVWTDANDQDGVRPANITLNLLADGEVVRTTVVNEETDWDHTFTGLPVYKDGVEINYTVTENTVPGYTTNVSLQPDSPEDFVVENTRTPDETSVTVTKAWDDANNQDGNRPDSIQVQLYSVDGEDLTPVDSPVEVLSVDNWTYTWTGLPENADGEPIVYTVEEVDASDDYTVSINDANQGNIIITNSYTPELTEVPVVKVWDDADNQDAERPNNITLNLLNDRGEIVRTAVVTDQDSNEWNYTFTDLPKFENGSEIQYTVTENFVSDYSTTVEEDPEVEEGYIVTNSLTPDVTSVTVTKGWNDANNQDNIRPDSIEVQLTADGESIEDVVVLNADNNWTYTWSGLDLNADGVAIDYSVEEVDVPEGYTSSINDSNHGNIIITNSYDPELIEIPVLKLWDDADNQDGVRPSYVSVNLLADGMKVGEAFVTESNDWEHVFTNLPRFKAGEQGVEIVYILNENSVDGYSLTGNEVNPDTGAVELTNTHTPDETSVTVTKAWDDANNQDGNRPDSIQVQLYSVDGEEVTPVGDVVEVPATDDWTYTWTGLPENADGEAIVYTVEEVNLSEDYTVSINDADQGNIIITNSYTPELIEVPVVKVWEDEDDQDAVRPSNITLNLLNDRGQIVDQVVVEDQDSNEWNYTFTDLPKFENGTEIQYRVTESFVSDYSTEIETDPTVENGYVVTNTYTPEETSVTVTKGWNDANNQDGNRPDSILVQLYSVDGEELTPVGEPAEVLATNDWRYTWTGLDLNADGEQIVYTVEEVDASEDYRVSINDVDQGNIIITNNYTPETTEVPVVKVWDDEDDQDAERPANITLNLLNDRGEIVRQAVVEDQDSNEWNYTFTNLPKFEDGSEIQYRVTENFVSDYSTVVEADVEVENGYVVTNTLTPDVTSVTVTKGWNDANNQDGNRPASIEVQLTADGEDFGEPVELTAADDWTYTWSGLDLNEDGEAIDYSVTELNVPEEYTVSINDRDHGNIIITNSYTPELIEIPVQKVWDDADNQDGVRPDLVIVNLLANGKKVREAFITESSDWQHVFSDLPRFQVGHQGEEIVYTLNENSVEGYSLTGIELNEDTGVREITNSRTPDETSVTVTKSWDDANNQDGNRPGSILVQLNSVDGEEVTPVGDAVEVFATDDWTYTWTGLPENSEGEAIVYTVEEVNVSEEYDVSVDDANHGNIIITNSYTPETIEVEVSKVWDDAEDQDRVRPNNVTVNLLNGSAIEESIVLSGANDWSYTFTDLPKFADGVEIPYSVTENTVAGYSSSIETTTTDAGLAGVVTNTYTPEETTATVTKVWNDGNNQDGNRPDSVVVQLFANGEAFGEVVEVTVEDNWTYTWTGLDLNEAGEAIVYTVEEVEAPADYEVSVNNEDHGNLMITNSYTPETTEVLVSKDWDDADNQDGVRPDSVTVNLLNGNSIEESVELNAENEWEHTFTDLPVYDNGNEINYTITENSVEDYSTSIGSTETDEGISYTVTNTHTPGETSATVTKVWNDRNNQDGNRPDSVVVQLLADGEAFGEAVEVTAEDNWTYTWTGLDLNEAGEAIVYTVEEVEVPVDYEVSVNNDDHGNLMITNSYAPETTEVLVSKIWDDADNQDGVRPDAVTVNLLNGYVIEESVVLSEENDWQYTFTDLPVYDNGNEVNYTVTENSVEDYSTSIEATETDEGVSYTVTNTHTPGETTATVTKVWDDGNNEDGNRPDSVIVQLLANGEAYGEPVEVTTDDDWTFTWTGLDLNSAGEAISYTVEELEVPAEYQVSVNNEDHGNLMITNSYTPEGPGEPEEPGEPGEPEEPEEPEEPSEPGEPEDPEEPSEPELPETGIALGTSVATTSLVLFALGGLVLFFTRRRFQQ
ncbi:MAG TPA: Cna B-type domain-containing protein [Aliicoccus persicus]|uniref:Cna B-type domain-containing protein n=1 Tax=Aliicoccus persicus TaxID=930138 RepID=A0A921DVH5_9STAP|nr:Cna B-type domain-containing protein [Aliicoccus persicus]